MSKNDLYLVYVNPVGKNSEDKFIYQFLFSENPSIVWGDGWDEDYPFQMDDLLPDKTTYSEVKTLITDIPLFCIQNNRCFSMRYAVSNVVAIAFEDISDYMDYPEPIRLVFQFGNSIGKVNTQLDARDLKFEEDEADK